MFGPWQDQLEEALGIRGQSRPGQRDRSRGQQAALHRSGASPAAGGRSAHNIPDHALDISMRHGYSAAEVNARMREAGIPGYAVFERGPRYGEGTAPHIHVDRRGPRSQRNRQQNQPRGNTQVANNRPISEISADELLGDVIGGSSSNRAPNQGRHPLVNPFEVEGEARNRAARVEGVLAEQDEFLTRFEETLEGVQQERRQRVEQSVAARRAVNDTVEAETRNLIERTAPIMQQRAQMASQLEHLAQMNPLERGLRGIFDLNYNERFLRERLDEYDAVLSTVGQDYQYVTALRERLMNTIETRDRQGAELENLDLTELDEEGRTVSLALQAANQSFAFLGDVVNQNENLVRAQVATVDRFLSEQTTAQLGELEGQARNAAGGRIVVDGVELSLGEIRQRRMAAESQDMAFESQQLALQAGRQEVADRAATLWARNATQTQLEAAINNGGVAGNGMRIPQDVLTAQLADRMQRTELIAGTSQSANPVRQLGQTMREAAQEQRLVISRARSMFGTTPPELAQATHNFAREAQAMATRIDEANAAGRPEVARALTQRLDALRADYQERIQRVALRHAGGDQRAAGWIQSYLMGSDLDEGQATDAMLFYAQRGSMPAGMRASPQARAAFNAAREAVRNVDTQIGTRRVSDEQRNNMYRDAIRGSLPAAYTGNTFNELISALPDIAARTNDPFRGVRREDFDAAMRAADSVPYQEIGRQLGISANDARLLFAGRYRGQNATELTTRVENENLRGALLARQQAVFADYLDRSPSATATFRPSRALAEMLQRPTVLNLANNMEQLTRSTSYGDFLASALSHGQLPDRVAQWSRNFSNQVNDIRIAEQSAGRMRASRYNLDPMHRASVVLAGIEGIDQHEEAMLMNAIRPLVPEPSAVGGAFQVAGRNDMIGRIISGQRFQNPQLERIRQIAAREWNRAAAATDRAVDAYEAR